MTAPANSPLGLEVVVQTPRGRATHLAATLEVTACGDTWTRTRLRTDRDPSCKWCAATLEAAPAPPDELARPRFEREYREAWDRAALGLPAADE